jgi:hypothetical protein
MTQSFIDALNWYLDDDPNTSQWLLPLEPLLHQSYSHRFRASDGVVYFQVYDNVFQGGSTWLTPFEFYERSKQIANEYIRRGYFRNLSGEPQTGSLDHDAYDVPTGG